MSTRLLYYGRLTIKKFLPDIIKVTSHRLFQDLVTVHFHDPNTGLCLFHSCLFICTSVQHGNMGLLNSVNSQLASAEVLGFTFPHKTRGFHGVFFYFPGVFRLFYMVWVDRLAHSVNSNIESGRTIKRDHQNSVSGIFDPYSWQG